MVPFLTQLSMSLHILASSVRPFHNVAPFAFLAQSRTPKTQVLLQVLQAWDITCQHHHHHHHQLRNIHPKSRSQRIK
ncbi:hypothetical protein CDV31_004299 [Fusarium ambrosium]|uniref:Uncharacterized protein n=1 Tax=Fusarium ambrosium TaxID=131363 RepID=A0A428URC4_9HYPO|nr:hypothetical protein CDV31_004299 [Fusarium ambrosium]